MLAKALMPLAERLDRRFGWAAPPVPARPRDARRPARAAARAQPLQTRASPGVDRPRAARRRREARRPDGSFNDLSQPGMGATGAPFGRNAPGAARTRTARRAAPARSQRRADAPATRFLPASHLNVLAAAWLQFEVHDWMSHAKERRRRLGAGRGHAAAEGDPDRRRPAGVRLPRDALVGRVAALRHAPGRTSPRSRAERRRDRGRRRPAARDRAPGRELRTRPRRTCGSGSRLLHIALRARAQRDRPPPARGLPASWDARPPLRRRRG